MTPLDLDLYRPNVGVVLFNAEGRVWLGRRAGTPGPYNWQFPQGGVDDGEDWETAARRELREETGVVSIRPLGETEGWITYDFPPEAEGSKIAKGWRGQKQKWFAYRFEGEDAEVNLEAHPPAEFDAWRWADLGEVLDLVVPFKRAAYEQVVAAFKAFAA
ncbi:RNA pyrophosphohydrolase [Caulobacter sp. 17J80-11]|uniref:RNA pyrophosphohydrolase n=1 Tax=Caulobacter sp. 17J80-11 TaxID=2763502 RepID=UPI0016538151|nr:RNA pyrophosphohydrolase [Caulobacter sp. 17J80-11]